VNVLAGPERRRISRCSGERCCDGRGAQSSQEVDVVLLDRCVRLGDPQG
jgi:hypothetical protein